MDGGDRGDEGDGGDGGLAIGTRWIFGEACRSSSTNFSTTRMLIWDCTVSFLSVGDSDERVGREDDSDEKGSF